MARLTAWLHRHNLTHPMLALCLFILPAALLGQAGLGAVFAIAFYYGREVRDAQAFGGADHGTIASLRFLWPGTWMRSNHLDFWPVVAVAVVSEAVAVASGLLPAG
jgi:hypothetical protein